MAKEKQYWLGKGTIGDISQGEEIPEGYLSEERFRQFEKEGIEVLLRAIPRVVEQKLKTFLPPSVREAQSKAG